MKIERIDNTAATIITKDNGDQVLFSYNTPVAAYVGHKYYKTEQHYSVTTSRHINKFLGGAKAEKKPQSFFDELM